MHHKETLCRIGSLAPSLAPFDLIGSGYLTPSGMNHLNE
jgi:hypothetical protein